MRTTTILMMTLGSCFGVGMGCGDGARSPGEAVAAQPGWVDGDAAVAPDSGEPLVGAGPKRVFVTSRQVYGDLVSVARGADGVVSGDTVCQVSADAAGLGGTWKAWLSSDTIDAIDHIRGNGPWARLDGVVLFPDHASLAGAPLDAINVDETGETVSCLYTSPYVWTGTRIGGRWNLDDCVGWTEMDSDWETDTGSACDPTKWTRGAEVRWCSSESRLFCFEQ